MDNGVKIMGAKKKSYSKPQIEKVQLVPEEAVLTGCKMAAPGSGKNSGKCNNNWVCSVAGS